jgi:hypothetical protein
MAMSGAIRQECQPKQRKGFSGEENLTSAASMGIENTSRAVGETSRNKP